MLWLDEDRGRLAAAQRHRRFIYPNRDRVAAKQSLMQDFDPGAFDKPEFDQPPLELGGRKAMVIPLDANRPNPPGHSDGGSAERHGIMRFAPSNASVLTRDPTSYCDSLSVASEPSHGWYRIRAVQGALQSKQDGAEPKIEGRSAKCCTGLLQRKSVIRLAAWLSPASARLHPVR
jgi:hypothetical protein